MRRFDDFSADRVAKDPLLEQSHLPMRPVRFKPDSFGNARMATQSELARLFNGIDSDIPTFRDVSVLFERQDGSMFPRYQEQLYLPADLRQRGILAIGPPGAGKTQELIFPLMVSDIQDTRQSAVIVGTKGDEEKKLRPFIEEYRPGTEPVVINFGDPARTTAAYNPLANCTNPGDALREAEEFCAASTAEKQGANHDSSFWDHNSARFIVAAHLIINAFKGQACPADLHRFFELPQPEILELLKQHLHVPFAAGCHAFLASGSHNAETVIATTQGHLRRFCDDRLAAATSAQEFDFERLCCEPTVVIIEVRQSDLALIRPTLNGFFDRLFSAASNMAAKQPQGRLPCPLSVILDDFIASVGKLTRFASFANLLRSQDVRLTAAVQTLAQFYQAYGAEADAVIAAFSTKIFKSPLEVYDARWASEQSGVMTVETEQRTEQDNGDTIFRSRTVSAASRPLLLPDEVRLSPEHFELGRASTVFLAGLAPFQAWFRPAYQTEGMAHLLAKASKAVRNEVLRPEPLNYVPFDFKQRQAPRAHIKRETLPPHLSDTAGKSRREIAAILQRVKQRIGWKETGGSAKKWWTAFEKENNHRLGLVLRLAEELAIREATVTEFFLAYVYSGTDNIQANLHYLDYTQLKQKEKEAKQKMNEAKQKEGEVDGTTDP